MCSFVLKRTTRKNMKMKRGTNLDRRASFERALPRFVLSPLPLFPVFPLWLRGTVLQRWINAREIPVFCTAKIRVFGSFTVLLCTRISISFLLVYRNTRKMAALLHSKQRLPTRTLTLSWKRSEKITFTVFFGFERPYTTSRQTIRLEISRKMHK